jgi:hypothetical protein
MWWAKKQEVFKISNCVGGRCIVETKIKHNDREFRKRKSPIEGFQESA